MDANSLTVDPAKVLDKRLAEIPTYLLQLQRRVDPASWVRSDRRYIEVTTARYSTLLLANHVHRIMCKAYFPRR
jgi:hypothetical protein